MKCEKCKYRVQEKIESDRTIVICYCTHSAFKDEYGGGGRSLPTCAGQPPVFCPLKKDNNNGSNIQRKRTSSRKKREPA